MALLVGASNDPVPLYEYAPVAKQETMDKIMSLCQDIVYLQSGGKCQTPKSLSLGLTLRHLTGSSDVGNLLHRFGHCSSYDTVTRYETGLATKLIQQSDRLPIGFERGKPTIFVYDNIDRAEETLSGAGTTHHTNGIMIQLDYNLTDATTPSDLGNISRRARTFSPIDNPIPLYYHSRRTGPTITLALESIPSSDVCRHGLSHPAYLEDAFLLMKSCNAGNILPGWTGFNRMNMTEIAPISRIHYLPVIEAPSTNITTIKAILDNIISMADKLERQSVIAVFDQAIYAKIQEVRWLSPVLCERVVVRLGAFHTVMSFLAVIGKRFSGSGFEDILIETQTVAPGSMNTVLNGHMYNRAMYAHKLMYEALGRLQVAEYLESLEESQRQKVTDRVQQVAGEISTGSVLPATLTDIHEDMRDYITRRCSDSPTYAYWNSYLKAVSLLLTFLRATRESDWDMHLHSLRLMLPYFHAYDRHNYAR